MKRIFFLMIVFPLLLVSAFDAPAQTEISVYQQLDAPLQILNVVPRSKRSTDNIGSIWENQTIDFTLQNVSNKTIRAYTLREFSGDFDTDLGGIMFTYKLSGDGIFKPNQVSNEKLGEGGFTLIDPNSPQIREISKLAVDFIEFTDSSTWGKDLSNSAQQLAGIKTGIKTILERLKKPNQQGGIEAVIKTLNEMKEISPLEEQSEKWKRGFGTGAKNMKSIIKRAYDAGGNKSAEIELQNYSDTYSDSGKHE